MKKDKYIATKIVTYPSGYKEIVTTDLRIAVRQASGEIAIVEPLYKLPIEVKNDN